MSDLEGADWMPLGVKAECLGGCTRGALEGAGWVP